MIGIYKITSPSGKIYIGQSKDIEKRKYSNYINGNCKSQIKLFNSIKKYGWDKHKFEIIEECSFDKLNEREIYWGIKFKVLGKNGLNCRLGDGKGLISEETRAKMSKARLGISRPKADGIAISKGKMGCTYPKERNEKISKATKGKPKPKGFGDKIKKTIFQFSKENKFIKKWDSVEEAGKFYEVKPASISNNLIGLSKSSVGYIWKYKRK